MKFRLLLLSALLSLLTAPWALAQDDEPQLSDDDRAYLEWAAKTWESLNPQTGTIKLPGAVATLEVPESFYYLSPEDSETVLVDIWGNPPGGETLGMLFPAGATPFDAESWGVTIEYEEEGYVSDDDAASIDYSDMLKEMQSDTRAQSKERVKQGYEAIELVGWAAPPYYDANTHKLYWAKEIKFGDTDDNTLNYNIRILGRKGVLLLNFIASMEQKPVIDSNLDTVLALAEFDTGSKYTDFNPSIDKVAAYGIGALVAGKVVAKTGLFAALLILLKKFGVFIVVGIGAIFKALFSRKKEPTA